MDARLDIHFRWKMVKHINFLPKTNEFTEKNRTFEPD